MTSNRSSIGVNVANAFYFLRIERAYFGVIRNLLVPIAGALLNLYLIYAAFFSSLWSAPFRTGKSVLIACLALFALQLLAVPAARLSRRNLLSGSAPIGVGR